MAYKKMNCWVVYGFYKDSEELPNGSEELCCTEYAAAIRIAEEWRTNDDYEEVTIEEEEREFWVE